MTVDEKTIELRERDQRLTFTIRAMRPLQLERWLVRALALLVHDQEAGGADFVAAGRKLAAEGLWVLNAVSDFEAVQALSDELLGCCSRVVGSMEVRCTPESVEGFVRDVSTLFTLKNEALKLNLGFLLEGEAVLGEAAEPVAAGKGA